MNRPLKRCASVLKRTDHSGTGREESLGDNKPADDLLNLEGLDRDMAFKLAARGVCTLEDLAEQGIDDLADIEGLTDEKAGELIMAARNICWFGDEA